jgi:hypothetical protein
MQNIIHLSNWFPFFSCNKEIQNQIQNEDVNEYEEKTRVYYNLFWIAKDQVQRYIQNVCVTHSRRDFHMTTLVHPDTLLNKKERLRARKHILACTSKIYAIGGCGPFFRRLLTQEHQKSALILFFPVIDWDLPNLDAETFFILHEKHERYKRIRDKSMLIRLPGGFFFDENAYIYNTVEDIMLLLMSAEEEQLRQKKSKKLWIKLPPLGLGAGVYTWNGIHIGTYLIQPFFWALLIALNAFQWTQIGVLEIVDITKQFAITPTWPEKVNNIQIVVKQERDILDFSPLSSSISVNNDTNKEVKDLYVQSAMPNIEEYDPCIVCPGDVFSWPGNDFYDTCLNSMIGNNTSLRRIGSPFSNPSLQNSNVYVPVRVPMKQIFNTQLWWPPREFSVT